MASIGDPPLGPVPMLYTMTIMSEPPSHWINVPDWLSIARGDQELPVEFARFIAAWEVLLAWRRAQHPYDFSDSNLIAQFKRRLPSLKFDSHPLWRQSLTALREMGPVQMMSGSEPMGSCHAMRSDDDFAGLVDVLYTVRCNLFKAGKRPTNPHDLDLSQRAATVATMIAEALLSAPEGA